MSRGEAIPEGDTVGRSESGELPVHCVRSPVEPTTKVWRVELYCPLHKLSFMNNFLKKRRGLLERFLE